MLNEEQTVQRTENSLRKYSGFVHTYIAYEALASDVEDAQQFFIEECLGEKISPTSWRAKDSNKSDINFYRYDRKSANCYLFANTILKKMKIYILDQLWDKEKIENNYVPTLIKRTMKENIWRIRDYEINS